MMTPRISVHAGVGGSVSSVMDSSPLPRCTRRLLGLNGLRGVKVVVGVSNG